VVHGRRQRSSILTIVVEMPGGTSLAQPVR
jgi:hypothetical protein